jgi:hypothetical protein
VPVPCNVTTAGAAIERVASFGEWPTVFGDAKTTIALLDRRDAVPGQALLTSERTRIVYVPVTPGGPVPAAEEFVSKPGSKVSHG